MRNAVRPMLITALPVILLSACVTAPSPGSVCPPLVERSQDWRDALADELDAITEARMSAGFIGQLTDTWPETTQYRDEVDMIATFAGQIGGLRSEKMRDAVQELGQLRAAIRAVCPELEPLELSR